MQIELQSTSLVVKILHNGAEVPARVWEGVTATGIKVQALVTRIAVEQTDNQAQFDRELEKHREPPAVCAFPLRMFL